MKYLSFWFLLAAICIANPIVVYEGVRDVQMSHEEVVLHVGTGSSNISGDYTFVQLAANASKKEDEFIRILLPVYVPVDEEVKLANLKAAYSPRITINGVTYEPTAVAFGGRAWSSFWRGATFYLAAFEFAVPRLGLADSFQMHVVYTQPHMFARGVAYACYCPFRPATTKNPLYRKIDDDQFTLRAVALNGVKLKRVSENQKLIDEKPEAIAVHCLDMEHVVFKIKKADQSGPK